MFSPEKKGQKSTNACHLSISSQFRTSAPVTCTTAPAWVAIQNLEKLFIVTTLVQSTTEVWTSVASCSLYYQGYPLPREGFFLAPSVSSAMCAKGPYCILWEHPNHV